MLLRYFVVYRWIRMPAYVLFLLWFALQFFGVWLQLSGVSHVSSLAHLGGAAAGLVFFLCTRSGVNSAVKAGAAGAELGTGKVRHYS